MNDLNVITFGLQAFVTLLVILDPPGATPIFLGVLRNKTRQERTKAAWQAAGTSLFIITINTITGFFAHYSHWNEVNWRYPIIIAVTAIAIARLASHRSSKVSPETLKRAFALLVYAIGAFQLIETWLVN